ncbi:hypothetical protein WJX82_001856 [Trebouxia sp. C0006]
MWKSGWEALLADPAAPPLTGQSLSDNHLQHFKTAASLLETYSESGSLPEGYQELCRSDVTPCFIIAQRNGSTGVWVLVTGTACQSDADVNAAGSSLWDGQHHLHTGALAQQIVRDKPGWKYFGVGFGPAASMDVSLAKQIQNRFVSTCHQEDPIPCLSDRAVMVIVLNAHRMAKDRVLKRVNDPIRAYCHLYPDQKADQLSKDTQLLADLEQGCSSLQQKIDQEPELVPPGVIRQLRGGLSATSRPRLQFCGHQDVVPVQPTFSRGTWLQNRGHAHAMVVYADLLAKA